MRLGSMGTRPTTVVTIAGAAYVFVRSGTTWTEEAKLLASDGAAVDLFGNSVSVSGETVVVGARLDGDRGTFSGSAYVFELDLDSEGPITSNLQTSIPSPLSMNDTFVVTATVDDTATGNSNILSATCELTNNSTDPPTEVYLVYCNPMTTVDSDFDSPTEAVQATIIGGTLALGVYDLCVYGTDLVPNVGAPECSILVVYDPTGSFVTGSGWILSSPEFCTICANAEGKANFGFVSEYKRHSQTPTGNTQFQFKAGDLNFHSTEYEWLVIAGPLAQYKGSGTINGAGNYGFMLTAKDSAILGGPDTDTFRIKIVDKDDGDTVVYDNGNDQAVDGGSIVIHTR